MRLHRICRKMVSLLILPFATSFLKVFFKSKNFYDFLMYMLLSKRNMIVDVSYKKLSKF